MATTKSTPQPSPILLDKEQLIIAKRLVISIKVVPLNEEYSVLDLKCDRNMYGKKLISRNDADSLYEALISDKQEYIRIDSFLVVEEDQIKEEEIQRYNLSVTIKESKDAEAH
ncbi:MAG: hypothetical protein ACPGSG_07355 [Prolixibacteraceae bacterium]